MMQKISNILLILLTLPHLLSAQFSVDFSASSYVDDNIYNSPYPEMDVLSDYSTYLNYSYGEKNINFYYEADYTKYNEISTRNYWLHEAGINYHSFLGEDEQYKLYLGAYWLKRIDTEENYYYDYSQLYSYLNASFSFEDLFVRTGYNLRYRSYDNLPDLTNYRHYLFLQLNKSFQTRTSIILETDFGYKTYAGVDIFNTVPGSGDDNYPPAGGGGGDGSGGGGGRGGQYSIESIEGTMETSTITTSIPSMGQAVILARVAQSIFEKMGVYVQYRKQISLTPETDYKNLDTQFVDEELFDDPFSYEGDAYSSKLSWILPWQTKIQIGGAYASKNYLNEDAYISEDDTLALGGLRMDDRASGYFNITKNFYFKNTWIEAIRLNLTYNYIKNESNSFWYNYKNSVYGAGLEFSF